MADENNLIIANTQFHHKYQHIVTWQSTRKNKLSYNNEPRKNPIRNQIDYILIPKHVKPLLKDARSYSGFDCGSDHRPVIAKLRMQLYRMKPVKRATALDFNSLKDEETKKNYHEHLTENLENIKAKIDQINDPTECYEILLETVHKATNEVLPKVPRGHKLIHSTEVQQISENQKKMRIDIQKETDAKKSEILRKKRNELLRTLRTKVQEERNQLIRNWLNDLQKCNNDSNKYFRSLRLINRLGQFQRQPLLKKKASENLLGKDKRYARFLPSTSKQS